MPGSEASHDEPVEDQPDFVGNALLKARVGYERTGLPTVADDSGLCVDALNGMPGVLSARWSGPPKSDERNNQLLLAQLADVPDEWLEPVPGYDTPESLRERYVAFLRARLDGGRPWLPTAEPAQGA